MDNETILTPEGHKKLLQELETLRAKRKDISDRIQEAKELGDLSENAEYHEAKNDQAFTEGRIAEIESTLHSAEIVHKPLKSNGFVQIGSTVKVLQDGKTIEYTIVGANEANPLDGKITHASPLGKVLLGKKKGDTVTVKTPKGEQAYTIEQII